MIVYKFGGTSLAEATKIKAVAKIIKSVTEVSMVVVSAPGKRFDQDIKVTDLLYSLAANTSQESKFGNIFLEIKSRFELMIKGLAVEGKAVLEALDAIAKEILQGVSQDFVASRGEYLNALLISEYLGFRFVDAAEFVRLRDDGSIDSLTYELGAKILDRNISTIVPGFYGLDKDGKIKTFSRGGSDITGAILAVCAQADVYQNWTDVSGVLTADPRIVDNPSFVPEITYAELRQMACFGTNVFHSEAISPVAAAGIPIQIKNTLRPEDKGTTISCQREVKKMPVVAVSGVKNLSKISINKENLDQRELAKDISALKNLGFKSIFSRFTADYAYIYGKYETDKLPEELECKLVLYKEKYTVLGLVGQGLDWAKVLSFVADLQDLPIIDFSFEQISATAVIVVEDSHYQEVIQIISDKIR